MTGTVNLCPKSAKWEWSPGEYSILSDFDISENAELIILEAPMTVSFLIFIHRS
jgi:hypothetical protein